MQYAVSSMLTGTPNTAFSTLRAIVSGILLLPTLTPFQTGVPGATILNLVFPFDNPAWSLCLELAANAFFFLYRPKGWRLVATVAALTLAAALYAVEASGFGGAGQVTFFAGFPRVLFGFFAGFALYRLFRAGLLQELPRSALAPVALAVLIALGPGTVPSLLIITMVVAPWIVALSVHDSGSPRLQRIFAWLGEASYPVYLIHFPILGLATLAWDEAFGLPLSAVLPTAPALALAVMVFGLSLALSRLYDAPARRWLTARRPDYSPREAPRPA